MKEHPILFNGDMVRAILDGRKTQTRRVVSSVKGIGKVTEFQRSDTPGYDWAMRDKRMLWNEVTHAELLARCPLGKVGDHLWVRETWRTYKSLDHLPPRLIEPGAGIQYEALGTNLPGDKGDYLLGMGKIRPSIFMPKWAARIWLEITNVSVQRLHDIRQSDALAEGIKHSTMNAPTFEFFWLWQSIYGADSWDANPWVWAITFKRVNR